MFIMIYARSYIYNLHLKFKLGFFGSPKQRNPKFQYSGTYIHFVFNESLVKFITVSKGYVGSLKFIHSSSRRFLILLFSRTLQTL